LTLQQRPAGGIMRQARPPAQGKSREGPMMTDLNADPFVKFKAVQREAWSVFAPVEVFTAAPAAKLVKFAQAAAGMSVLDVARGTGVVAVTAGRLGAKAHGLDLSPSLPRRDPPAASDLLAGLAPGPSFAPHTAPSGAKRRNGEAPVTSFASRQRRRPTEWFFRPLTACRPC
jgi:hypothetical protein